MSGSEDLGFSRTPVWLRGLVADAVSAVQYGLIDVLKEAARQAAKAGLIDHAPDDAIPYHSRSRMLDRVEGESIAAWRIRLREAWTFWAGVTLKSNLQDALRLYTGLPTQLHVVDFQPDGDDWMEGYDPAGFDDEDYDNVARLNIVIEQTHGWTRPVVGAGLIVGPGVMVGLTMTQTQLSRIRKYFQLFRPGPVIGQEIHVLMDSTTLDDYRSDHSTTSDVVRLALHAPVVGYPSTNVVVGPQCVVGQKHI